MVASVDLAAPPAPLSRQTAPSARTAPDIPAALRMGRGSGSVMFDAGRKWADAARGRRDVSSLRSSRRARPVFVRSSRKCRRPHKLSN